MKKYHNCTIDRFSFEIQQDLHIHIYTIPMYASAYSHDFDPSPLKGIIILILTGQSESTRNKLLLLVCELTP